MQIIYTTDLHGNIDKYEKIFELAHLLKIDVVINGGDMYPKNGNLLKQGKFITDYLHTYFQRFNESKKHYLFCY